SVFKSLPTGANPFDVEINPADGMLYWNETGNSNRIRRTRLDGSGAIETVASFSYNLTNGLAVDSRSGVIYYTTYTFEIRQINTDGTGASVLVPDLYGTNYLEVLHLPTSNTA